MLVTGAHVLPSLGPIGQGHIEAILEAHGHDPRAAAAGWRSTDWFVAMLMFAASGFPTFYLSAKDPWNTHGFKDATTNLNLMSGWKYWNRSGPIRGYGIRTGRYDFLPPGGPPGLWALDIDGPAGFDRLKQLEAKLGPLPITPTVKTGRAERGEHLLYLPYETGPDMKTLGAAKIDGMRATGLDQKGRGGYLVGAGNIHVKSGQHYEWVRGRAPDEVPFVPFPVEWAEIMDKADENSAPKLIVPREKRTSPPPYVRRTHEGGGTLIGDGPGYSGFNDPIYRIAIIYFFEAGVDAPEEIIIDTLREMIAEAPKDPGRDISRYLSGSELPRIVDRARKFVTEVKESESVEYPTK